MKLGLDRLVIIISLALTGCQAPSSSGSGANLLPTPKGRGEMVVCPMDARICPDGRSSVGRTGPHCEFAACPRG